MSSDTVSPEEAFAILGDEARISIIRTLGDANGESLSFSEMYNASDIDDSGRFNYHLKRLVGTFLKRTDDGTYELTYAGRRVIGAILNGDFNLRGVADTLTLDSECLACEIAVEATYADELVSITCPSCDAVSTAFPFPPGGFEGRDDDDLTDAFDRYLANVLGLVTDGICSNCAGIMQGTLADYTALEREHPVGVEFSCERCMDTAELGVSTVLFYQPAVQSFYHNRGIVLPSIRMWNLAQILDPQVRVVSEDPLQIESVVSVDGDELTLVIEDDLTVHVRSG